MPYLGRTLRVRAFYHNRAAHMNGSSAAVLDPTQADILIEASEINDSRTHRRHEHLVGLFRRFEKRSDRTLGRVEADLSDIKGEIFDIDRRLIATETRLEGDRLHDHSTLISEVVRRQAIGEAKAEQVKTVQTKWVGRAEAMVKAALLGALGFAAKAIKDAFGSP